MYTHNTAPQCCIQSKPPYQDAKSCILGLGQAHMSPKTSPISLRLILDLEARVGLWKLGKSARAVLDFQQVRIRGCDAGSSQLIVATIHANARASEQKENEHNQPHHIGLRPVFFLVRIPSCVADPSPPVCASVRGRIIRWAVLLLAVGDIHWDHGGRRPGGAVLPHVES